MNYTEFNKTLLTMIHGKNHKKMIVKCSDGLFALHDEETGEIVAWVKTNHATVEDKNLLLDQLEFMEKVVREQTKIIKDKEQKINELENIIKQQKKLIGVLYEASGFDD